MYKCIRQIRSLFSLNHYILHLPYCAYLSRFKATFSLSRIGVCNKKKYPYMQVIICMSNDLLLVSNVVETNTYEGQGNPSLHVVMGLVLKSTLGPLMRMKAEKFTGVSAHSRAIRKPSSLL